MPTGDVVRALLWGRIQARNADVARIDRFGSKLREPETSRARNRMEKDWC
jgi:hypothetical protein